MMTPDTRLLTSYQLRLPTFEGPLDVLLRLIERDQLAIADVSLVAVTDQFLAYVNRLGSAPAEVLAEFATVAARLILLKSRSLLPRPHLKTEQDVDPDDLVTQLTDYRRFQEAALLLGERDSRGTGAYGRGMGIVLPVPSALSPLAPHQPSSLARALRRRFSQAGPDIQVMATRPIVTVREIVARALSLAASRGRFRFRDVLSGGADRQEVLTAFLAILVLVRRRVMDAEQTTPFGDITLQPSTTEPSAADQDDGSEDSLGDEST